MFVVLRMNSVVSSGSAHSRTVFLGASLRRWAQRIRLASALLRDGCNNGCNADKPAVRCEAGFTV
jgi:hypothetical protein